MEVLSSEINNSGSSITLYNDYIYNNSDDKVFLNKSVTIEGNDHSIDANNNTIFEVTNNNNIIFKNITFNNVNEFFMNITCVNSNITFLDCNFNFINNYTDNCVNVTYNVPSYGFTCEISSTIKNLAEAIVGQSTDLDAAKKLAKWVGRNFDHETRDGFYQTPDETLNRRIGNCCSLTDLFLQMCVAVGVDKNHKLYYVHTGTPKFGKRHFFAMIDNILVDVGSKPYNPWGHALFIDDVIYGFTEYPMLPLPRNY